jgi:hypothetical protein
LKNGIIDLGRPSRVEEKTLCQLILRAIEEKKFKSTSSVSSYSQPLSCRIRIRSIRKFQLLCALCGYILFIRLLSEEVEIEYSPATRSYSQTNADFILEKTGSDRRPFLPLNVLPPLEVR